MTEITYNTLNSGIYSDNLKYRTDFEKRASAVEDLINGNVQVQGGISRRAGTRVLYDSVAKYMLPNDINTFDLVDTTITQSQPNGAYSCFVGDILIPYNSTEFGYFDNSVYLEVETHGEGAGAFSHGVKVGDTIYCIPYNSAYIGKFDRPSTTYTQGPAHGEGAGAFSHGIYDADENAIYLVPFNSAYLGKYDIDTDTYSQVVAHGQGTGAFKSAVMVNGDIYFAPYNADNVCLYSDAGTFSAIAEHNQGDSAFSDVVVGLDNELIFIPSNSYYFAKYNMVSGVFALTATHPEGTDAFAGGARPILSDGETLATEIIITPFKSAWLSKYDLTTHTYTRIVEHGQGTYAFSGKPTRINTVLPFYFAPYNTSNFYKAYYNGFSLFSDKTVTHYKTIGMAKAGATGSDHIIVYTNRGIMAYDIEGDYLSNVNYVNGVVDDDLGYVDVPVPTDYVILNDIIYFTCENDNIHRLVRKFDSNGLSYFEFGEWDYNPPSETIISDGYTTARCDIPIAYKPGAGYNTRWVEGNYYRAMSRATEWVGATGFEWHHNPEYDLGNGEVGARKLYVITNQKFTTEWSGNRLVLTTPGDIEINRYDRFSLIDDPVDGEANQRIAVCDVIDGYDGYRVIPNADDLDGSLPLAPQNRYVAVYMEDKVNIGTDTIGDYPYNMVYTLTETDVDNVINNTPELIKPLVKSEFCTVTNQDYGSIFEVGASEDQNAEYLDNTLRTSVDLSDFAPFTNAPAGWVFSDDVRVRDVDRQTNFNTTWGTGVTVAETIELGMVLGDWSFRTSGNWAGSFTIETSRDNIVWSSFGKYTSNNDNNVAVNDGYEGDYGVFYRLVIDIVTDTGEQAVDAGYNFDWDNFNAFYSKELDYGQVVLSTWYADNVKLYFESICFHQNRLWLSYKSKIYASEINNFRQFASYGLETEDSAYFTNLADTQTSHINWLHVNGKSIVVGTENGLWSYDPKERVAVRQSSYGVSEIKPINVGSEMLYIDKSNKRIYATIYDFNTDALVSNDITIFSEVVFKTNIKGIVYDDNTKQIYVRVGYDKPIDNNAVLPNPLTFASDDLDQIVTIQYDKTQNVIACNRNKYSSVTDTIVSFNDIVVIGRDTYTSKLDYSDDFDDMVLKLTKFENDICGDYYDCSCYSKEIDYSDVKAKYIGKDVYYRSTYERAWSYGTMTDELFDSYLFSNGYNYDLVPIMDERYRKDYVGPDGFVSGYYKGIELMLPISLEIRTFPFDFGMGLESTWGKRKSLSEVGLAVKNTNGGWISLDEGSTKEYYADGTYNNQLFDYLPIYDKGVYDINIFDGGGDEVKLSISDESPYPTRIDALIYTFALGN